MAPTQALIASKDEAVFRRIACISRASVWHVFNTPGSPNAHVPEECFLALHAYREKRVRSMSDKAFLACFPRQMDATRATNLGASRQRRSEESSYWEYVRDRLKRLRPDD